MKKKSFLVNTSGARFLFFIVDVVVALRPKQWIKNLFVFAGLFFGGIAYKIDDLKLVTLVFVAFCFVSSSGYLFNDLKDREKDRHHPRKRFRPIPLGRISPLQASFLGIVLLILSFVLAVHVSSNVAGILILYAVITYSYSFFFKRVVLLDVFVLSLGFVVRVVAGAIASSVFISPWLVICTLLTALFLAVNKRRAEFLALEQSGKHLHTRETLSHYSEKLLSEMSTTLTSATLVTYSLYAFFISTPLVQTISPTSPERPRMMLTIPVVIYAIFRYLYLVHQKKSGESAEEVIFKDIPFAGSIFLWAFLCYVIIYRTHWLDFMTFS